MKKLKIVAFITIEYILSFLVAMMIFNNVRNALILGAVLLAMVFVTYSVLLRFREFKETLRNKKKGSH